MDHSIEITVNEDENECRPRRVKSLYRHPQADSSNLASLIKINHPAEEDWIGTDNGFRKKLLRSFSFNEVNSNRRVSMQVNHLDSDSSKSPKSKPMTPNVLPTSRKLSLITNKNDKVMMDFGNAIRSGFTDVVKTMLEIHGVGLMNQLGIQFETQFRKIFGKTVVKLETVSKPDRIYMTPFHLAIISQQSNVVTVMLQFARKTIKTTLDIRTKVFFATNDPSDYHKEDKTMDGINAFHLAGRFHAHSLLVILTFLRDIKLLASMMDLFEATDPHMGKTPLHMAVKSPSHVHTAMFILAGVDINAKDKRGYTALHIAAKEGYKLVCETLLEYGADPNIYGKKPNYCKTPLHRARTKKVAKVLLKYGADPFARNFDNTCSLSKEESISVLDTFLMNNPDAASEIINYGIHTNGQELDSADLQIVYDFELFYQERTELVDESMALRKIADNAPFLLQNPLVEGYLSIKWQMWKKEVYFNVFMMALFLLFLSLLVVMDTRLEFCSDNAGLISLGCNKSDTSLDILDVLAITREKGWTFGKFTLMISYSLCWLLLLYLIIRELFEALYFKRFFHSCDNFLDSCVILTTMVYLILLLFEPLKVSAYFGPIAIFLGFWDITLMLGRLPIFGNPIFLLISILQILTKYFVFFVPILLAFALVFRAAMPTQFTNGIDDNSDEFTNMLYSLVKIIAMMVGEYDFRETFLPYIEDGVFYPVGSLVIGIFFIIFVIVIRIGNVQPNLLTFRV